MSAPDLYAAAEAVCKAHEEQRALWNAVDLGLKTDDVIDALFAAAVETGERIDTLRAALVKARGGAS
jgi:hypothetical protein